MESDSRSSRDNKRRGEVKPKSETEFPEIPENTDEMPDKSKTRSDSGNSPPIPPRVEQRG